MRNLLAIALLATSINSYADECESIIALSKTVSTVVQDKNSVDTNSTAFCNEYYQAKSSGKTMEASASYKFLLASFGSSQANQEEVASKYCSASSTHSKRDDAYKQYIETISPNAYSAYEQCIGMLRRDIKFSLDAGSLLPKEFSMTVSYQPSGAGSTATLAISSSEDVTCSWNQSTDKAFTFSATGSVDLSCRRDDQAKKSFVKVTRTNGTEKLTFPWPRFDASGNQIDSLLVLQNQYSDLAKELTALENSLKSSVVAFNSTSCPVGWEPYKEAYGRFIRGIDKSGSIDPDGARNPGGLQDDAIKNHIHNLPNNNVLNSGANGGKHSPWVAGNGIGKTGEMVDGASNETRPKNVSLLYCYRK